MHVYEVTYLHTYTTIRIHTIVIPCIHKLPCILPVLLPLRTTTNYQICIAIVAHKGAREYGGMMLTLSHVLGHTYDECM